MKKFILFLLLVTLLCGAISCKEKPDINSQLQISENEKWVSYPESGRISKMTETPTRIIFTLIDTLYYYNTMDNVPYVFCFDSLCKHNDWRSCISLRFMMNGVTSKIQYCGYNNRFYALRGEKLCSFSFDGSDLKIEYSFGEKGSLDEFIYSGQSADLQIWKNRVYFGNLNSETGTREVFYFEIDTGDIVHLTENIEDSVINFIIYDESLYFEILKKTEKGSEFGTYRSDMDMQQSTLVLEGFSTFDINSVFHKNEFYYVEYAYVLNNEDAQSVPVALVSHNFDTDEKIILYQIEDGVAPQLLAVTDSYVYFIKQDMQYIGYELVRGTIRVDKYNNFSKIYRLDIKSGECKVVFDDLQCQVGELRFVSPDKVLILGQYCKASEGEAELFDSLFVADIDENGHFINLALLEVTE